jgi:iron complex outermembrane receptor protein
MELQIYTYYNPTNRLAYGNSYLYGTNGNSNGILYLDNPDSWASGSIPAAEMLEKNRINTRRIGVYAQDFISLTKN